DDGFDDFADAVSLLNRSLRLGSRGGANPGLWVWEQVMGNHSSHDQGQHTESGGDHAADTEEEKDTQHAQSQCNREANADGLQPQPAHRRIPLLRGAGAGLIGGMAVHFRAGMPRGADRLGRCRTWWLAHRMRTRNQWIVIVCHATPRMCEKPPSLFFERWRLTFQCFEHLACQPSRDRGMLAPPMG